MSESGLKSPVELRLRLLRIVLLKIESLHHLESGCSTAGVTDQELAVGPYRRFSCNYATYMRSSSHWTYTSPRRILL